MSTQPPEPLKDRLSDREAADLIARASHLDALHGASTDLATLRAAATEAGISVLAFEGALHERRAAEKRSRWLRWSLAAVVAGFILVGSLTFPWRRGAPVPATIEEAFVLKCLPAIDAADLIRPLVRDPWSTLVVTPGYSPHLLTVRTTAQQLERIRDLLATHDEPTGAACRPSSPSRAM